MQQPYLRLRYEKSTESSKKIDFLLKVCDIDHMTLPESIQRELEAAKAKTPEGELYKLVLAAFTIASLLHMGPLQAELYMASKYREME